MTETTMQVYSEVDSILDLMADEYVIEIPVKLRALFKEKKSTTYTKEIDVNIPLDEQGLKEETLAVLAVLNYNYWCKDDERKKELISTYTQNEQDYQEKLIEKFSSEDMFKKRVDETISEAGITDNTQNMVEYKEPFFTRFINKIKSFFHRN